MNLERAVSRYKSYGKGMRIIQRQIPLRRGHFINAIIGPRRAGKTFLMLMHRNSIQLPDSNKMFISGEDIDLEGIKTDDLDELERIILNLYNPDRNKEIYFFIDEVQNLPSWSRWVRTLFDENRYKIVISGSTSELAADNVPNELRGRAANLLVLPFSFAEYCTAKNVPLDRQAGKKAEATMLSQFEEFVNFGGYPLVVEAETPESKYVVVKELYETVMQKDITSKHRIRKSYELARFMNSAIGSAARVFSVSKLAEWLSAQGMRISPQTALNYVSYAQSAFLFFLLQPYSAKPKVRNTRPKLYLSDSGLLALADTDLARKLENQVFVELARRGLRVFYHSSRDYEVDFVIEGLHGIDELIQVSYSLNDQATYERETKSLAMAAKELHCDKLKILTFNEERKIRMKGKTIEVVPAWKWMLEGE